LDTLHRPLSRTAVRTPVSVIVPLFDEEAFEWLDAPVRVIGALDTPVPYSPPLEEFFLPGEQEIERAARLLAAY
jgi:2-oxoisovalerate dehydrogenase E1 component beta subunit